jgi:formylmethanofuran dehydrogenase subunit C
VSDHVALIARAPIVEALDTEGLTPDRLARLPESAIAHLPVWRGRERLQVGDVFTVRGGHATTVIVEGGSAHVHGLGAGMTDGTLIIDGDAGHFVAAGMGGGVVEVKGSIGDDGAVGMSGGVFEVVGNCGARVGGARPGASRGMTGGEIVVRGHAGDSVGAFCRRGLLAVAGDVGQAAAHGMIAGSLFVFGRTGRHPAQFNKRGSLVALGEISVPETYRYACRYRPPHVRVTLLYLARRYGLAVDARHVGGHYRRYCGDRLTPGKGEILVWSDAG